MAKIDSMENELISIHVSFTGLIFTVFICVLFFLNRISSRHILPTCFGAKFKALSDRDRRSMTFHSTAIFIKITVLAALVYPFVQLIFLDAEFSDPISPNGAVTNGDMLLITGNLFASMFVLEMYYRGDEISYLSVIHHVGTVIIGQTALALGTQPDRYPEAAIELYMCTVWAMFEILAYLTLDPILIARKFYRERYPKLIRKLIAGTGFWALGMTLMEIAVTVYLLFKSWSLWGLEFKIITPLVFGMWCTTQLWFCKTVYGMWMAQGKVVRDQLTLSAGEEDCRRPSRAETAVEVGSLSKEDGVSVELRNARCDICERCFCR